MPKITINDQEMEVEAGLTVLQACELAGVEIPRFCYHERLSIAGNCRMCLVEVSPGPPKPQASCALPVMEGQIVKTNTPMVEKARKGVMEFLLINHPLDCPICDQGGECDLQDQAVAYGSNLSRYKEAKRAVEDKYMGPVVKTIMNRCIHCTRCVRFVSEVAGVDAIGLLNRGTYAEISALEQGVNSELSGNLVDLCPVGALTSKPYSYHARSWELAKTPSIDVTDALCSNIRIDSRGNEVMRILPRVNESVNEEWISDKSRLIWDGLKRQRLDRPYIRNKAGKLQVASWGEALMLVAEKLKAAKPANIGAVIGDLTDVETAFAMKGLMDGMKVPNLDCRIDQGFLPNHGSKDFNRAHYLFNSSVDGIDQMDALLIVGSNIRHEAAVLNARIRKRFLTGQLKIAYIGAETQMTYDADHLGNDPRVLNDVLAGKHGFSKILKGAKNPAIIVGQGALAREDGAAIYGTALKIAAQYNMIRDDWVGFNVLAHHAGRNGGLDVGFLPKVTSKGRAKNFAEMREASKAGKLDVIYLLGVDVPAVADFENSFVIYQGHHGDLGAHHADVILPGAAYSEKDATYVNLEGRVQQTKQAVVPPGEARADWQIIRALSDHLEVLLDFDDLLQLRAKLYKKHKWMAGLNKSPTINAANMLNLLEDDALKQAALSGQGFVYPIENFYMTDVIGRASETMAKCTAEFTLGQSDMQEVAA
ncbi:MAG: NADH-quinone oxidoreductase subunit NuoG, partial [Alphaproteobacteria bacterium]